MLVKAKTEALNNYMYEKLNDLPETEDEKQIRYLKKKEIHEPPKNQQKNRQVSRKKTARAAKPQSGHDSPNKRLGEKIRKMRED